MRQSTLKFWAKLSLIAVISLPLSANAKSSNEQHPVDLSILEQSRTLVPFMTAVQKLEYVKLEGAIDSAQLDLRSGHILASTKPSKLDPNQDVSATIERGERRIERAQQALEASQIKLVTLLTSVEEQRIQQLAINQTKFNYILASADYEEALQIHCQQLLETCWALGYESLFFDGVFIGDSKGTHRSDAALRNQAYDTLIKIDGNTFSVTTPVDFKLKADTRGQGSLVFSYDNISIFQEDKKALLVFELITPQGSSTGLLSLRAIDLDTQIIAAQQLVKITNLAEVLGGEPQALIDGTPEQIELKDQANTLEILSNLAKPYTYEVTETSATKVAASLLTYTLLKNSTLLLADSDFIFRAYGKSLDMPEAWVGQANAQLNLTAIDEPGSYQLSAQADGSERILESGTLTLR